LVEISVKLSELFGTLVCPFTPSNTLIVTTATKIHSNIRVPVPAKARYFFTYLFMLISQQAQSNVKVAQSGSNWLRAILIAKSGLKRYCQIDLLRAGLWHFTFCRRNRPFKSVD
jgi:hypothetical protein